MFSIKDAPLVRVVWLDACTFSGWRDAFQVQQDIVPPTCESVGWLIVNDEDKVTLAASRAGDGEDNEVNSVFTIPQAFVRAIELLNAVSVSEVQRPKHQRATKGGRHDQATSARAMGRVEAYFRQHDGFVIYTVRGLAKKLGLPRSIVHTALQALVRADRLEIDARSNGSRARAVKG